LDDQDDDRRARAPEPDDVVRICRALNDAGARYLLIGGFAVIAHGAGRFTKDIDLLVDDAPANVARVKLLPNGRRGQRDATFFDRMSASSGRSGSASRQ
jgi:hypothetical protein